MPALAALVATLGLVAYSPLLWPGAAAGDLGQMLFRPGAVPPPLIVAVAALALWRRRRRLRDAAASTARGPSARGPVILAALLASLGTGAFVWSELVGSPRLLLPSLAASTLAVAAAAGGWAGCRAALLPAGLLGLGFPLPRPLEDEVLWQLQLATASGAEWLLAAVGREFVHGGVILRDTEHSFHVIDGCAGLSGIAILTMVAFIVRELFAGSAAGSARRNLRLWAVVAVAPPLAFALNLTRVAYIAASPDPAALAGVDGDHTGQGLAVLMTGTAILYFLGWFLGRVQGRAPKPAPPSAATAPSPSIHRATARFAVALAACLALLSATLPRFPDARSAYPVQLGFPAQQSGWSSGPAPREALFNGVLSGGTHRRYQRAGGADRPPQVVDLLVGFESHDVSGASFRLLSSKLAWPGPDWQLVERGPTRIWLLDRDAVMAISARGEEHAISYAWRPRDRGLWRETWRAALALESTPFRRERPRAAVRLVAYAPHDGQLVLDRAKQRLDRFVRDFREELNAL